MKKLIEALQIFLKYKNKEYPTCCDHDILYIMDITKDEVSKKDAKKLNELGFFWNDESDGWASYKYGSA